MGGKGHLMSWQADIANLAGRISLIILHIRVRSDLRLPD